MVKLVVTDKDGREVAVDARAGLSIMENIRTLPRSVEAICGGMCACATCHVHIDPAWAGSLPRRTYEEQTMLKGHAAFDPVRSRLSCQIVVREAFDGLRMTVVAETD
jgi:ferredoxin, 2Fe-2S